MATIQKTTARPEIGIIGGSGFYELFDDRNEITQPTPFGEPADAITIGTVGDRPVAFLPRHGRGHRLPAHRINYRANLWALRSLGVRQVLAPCAVGSLAPDSAGPGTVVVPDQVIDRTTGRAGTFYDEGAVHVPFADPYCPNARSAVVTAGAELGMPVIDGTTMVVIDGPRFSSRAESRWYAAIGCALVNMTGQPEAALARELSLCYAPIALVTDLDAGIDAGDSVSQSGVLQVFEENINKLRSLVLAAVARLPTVRSCLCPASLDGLAPALELP
jgi:5'-methylthioadenosine phosphorylase